MANMNVDEEKQSGSLEGKLMLSVDSTDENRVKISVVPPILGKKESRRPVSICCVVDTSGSMGCDAVIKDENGKEENHGLSILDLVKHSIKTIIESLDKNDYLSIISYSNEAKVVTNLIQMKKKNKKKTLNALTELQADGQTNLWAGLLASLEQLRNCKGIDPTHMNSAVMLFTDGLPNIVPPKGHIPMLTDYLQQYSALNVTINTYGFGYSLDTKLLTDLAVQGKGNFAFIPDSTMVGTIFVNSISNFLCNAAKDVTLDIEFDTKANDKAIIGGYPHQLTAKGSTIDLGNVMYGQSRDLVLNIGKVENVSMRYISLAEEKYVDGNIEIIYEKNEQANKGSIERNYFRLKACDVLQECMQYVEAEKMKEAQTVLKDLIKSMKSNELINKDKYTIDLVKDLSGQAFEAIANKESYEKWGRHYLPSLRFAHLNQICNNFKDPGVQHYGGSLFNQLRDSANDIFIKMPAPTSSYKPPAWLKDFQDVAMPVAAPRANVNMASYMNVGGGCFHGDCLVLMGDASLKRVRDLRYGDRVANGAAVVCVIRYKCKDNKAMLTTLHGYNSLKITPYHPIRVDNEWIFPMNVGSSCGITREEECDSVFNVVLSEHHILMVNGVECCSLGHNFSDNDVIKHEYFGTQSIIRDLKKCSGWKQGCVELAHNAFTREAASGLVCGLSTNL